MAANIGDKIQVNMLLIGKTGHGRSSAGNSILNEHVFDSSPNATTANVEVKDASVEIGSYLIKVVDCPGLENPELTQIKNIEAACKNMSEALSRCEKGVHAFILVLKFGERFTRENQKTIATLRSIFGENFLKERGIILLTCGDQLSPTMTVEEWYQAQEGIIKTLFMECGHRIVLFNNVTKSEEEKQRQREKLLHEMQKISINIGSYKNKHFQKHERIRKQLIEDTFTMFIQSVQIKTNALINSLRCLTIKSSVQDVEHAEKHSNDLQKEIQGQDTSEFWQEIRGVLEGVQTSLQQLKQGGNKEIVIMTLRKRKNELEALTNRLGVLLQHKTPWRDILFVFLLGIAVGSFFEGRSYRK